MKIAVLGAGAMGSLFGGLLAETGNDVTLVDVRNETVEAINASGLRLEGKSGETRTVPVRATTNPADIGRVDLVIVFVKSYDTEVAIHSAEPTIKGNTLVLTLQNGWGNAARIAGLTYHSATVLGPGRIQHAGRGSTVVGELIGQTGNRLGQVVDVLNAAGFETTPTANIVQEIWSKLAMNVCTLPTSALLKTFAGQLLDHQGALDLMRAILRETVAVANAQGMALSEEERWEAITGLLKRSSGAKPSMLQDVEKRRRTEIDVINGAVVADGKRLGIPTPYNDAMVWLIRSLEETFHEA